MAVRIDFLEVWLAAAMRKCVTEDDLRQRQPKTFWRRVLESIAAAMALCILHTSLAQQVVRGQAPPPKVATLPNRPTEPQVDAEPQASAEPQARVVDYFRDVKPILLKNCYACHGPSQAESRLRLDLRDRAMQGGDGGPIIVQGDSRKSRLIQYITGQNDAGVVMPPKERAPPLAEKQIALLQAWIDQGAKWPDIAATLTGPASLGSAAKQAVNAKSDHWAFQPVRTIKPPVINDPWINTPIDAFVLEKLQSHRLAPNPAADRIDLIRRVSFDLIGLPPSPEAVQAFLADTSSDAYERFVDHLLSSPRYGERWARHWLDLARYADTDGFELDNERKHAYKYRDYVIQSFNDDKPYDQFIREQIAGDELSGNSASAMPSQLVGLGFCRNGPSISNQQSEKNRLDEVDDMVSTTASVFLGLTVGCARCHDHKYEPISQRDYYRLFAVFNTAEKSDDGEIMQLRETDRPSQNTRMLPSGELGGASKEMEPGIPEVLDDGRTKIAVADGAAGSRGRRLALAHWIAASENPLTARVLVNRLWLYHFGRGIVNSPSNFGQSGDVPTHPELLDYLARELVRDDWRLKRLHKLIVMSATYRQSSTFDPLKAASDPQALWYWRYPLRRLEAESIRDAVLAASGSLNLQMYGPGIKPRIPTAVFAAGQETKWPKIAAEGPEHWRRSVYIFVKRSLPVPMLESFDSPATTQTCERRQATTLATQALQLMNDEFTNDQALRMADRVVAEAGEAVQKQIERAYWRAFSRPPTASEAQVAVEFVEQRLRIATQSLLERHINADLQTRAKLRRNALADLCHVLLNANEFIYLD